MQDLKLRPFLASQLMRPVTAGRIAHSQIFFGPKGTGKESAAKYVSMALNCTDKDKPCGACPSCLRFKDDTAPELTLLSPEGSSIKVDAIRALLKELSLRPDGRYKCVIIRDADKMNDSAQNALLKTLEEAPSYAVFFLLTERYTALLPTIRSRCALLRFNPLSDEEVRDYLVSAGIKPEDAAINSALAGGSIGKALKISGDEGYKASLGELTNIMKRFKTERDIPLIAGGLAYFKNEPTTLLTMLEMSAGELMRGEEKTPLTKALKNNGHDGVKLMKAVITCQMRLDSHVSYQYASEMLLFDMISRSNV